MSSKERTTLVITLHLATVLYLAKPADDEAVFAYLPQWKYKNIMIWIIRNASQLSTGDLAHRQS